MDRLLALSASDSRGAPLGHLPPTQLTWLLLLLLLRRRRRLLLRLLLAVIESSAAPAAPLVAPAPAPVPASLALALAPTREAMQQLRRRRPVEDASVSRRRHLLRRGRDHVEASPVVRAR
jgi:hypothetical protein